MVEHVQLLRQVAHVVQRHLQSVQRLGSCENYLAGAGALINH